MLLQDGTVKTLVDLGLSVLQAKVYIALARLGTSTGRTAAKAAKVAPQDVYRILAELQEKGFVEKIIAKPNLYKPTPLDEGLEMLLQRRDKQTEELEKECTEISRAIRAINGKNDLRNEIGDFVLIPKKEPIEKSLSRMWQTTRFSIDMINYFEEGIIGHEKKFESEIKALNRGVKIRDILFCPHAPYRLPEPVLALQKMKPLFCLRYTHFPPPAVIIIKDDREVFISTMTKVNTLSQPYLWSNNFNLVQLMKHWYEMIWEKTTEAYVGKQSAAILLSTLTEEEKQ